MCCFITEKYSLKFSEIDCDISEILRYMGCKKDASTETYDLIYNCLNSINKEDMLKLCYMFLPIKIKDNEIDFELFKAKSKYLSKNLINSQYCVLFGATAGASFDRKINKYSQAKPSVALCYQAIGTELTEKFCDKFENFLKEKYNFNFSPRFSPGYADLGLTYQKRIFEILNLPKNCGMTLTDSLIMRPSKSVTAIMGITNKECNRKNDCTLCSKADCDFRKN